MDRHQYALTGFSYLDTVFMPRVPIFAVANERYQPSAILQPRLWQPQPLGYVTGVDGAGEDPVAAYPGGAKRGMPHRK